MSRIIPFVVAVLVSPHLVGEVFAQLTPPAGSAGAGMAPISGVPYGPANPRALSDPNGIGNASSVPPLRSNIPATSPSVPSASSALTHSTPARAVAPSYYPSTSQRISAYAVEPKSKTRHRRPGRRQVSSFTGICRGC